MLSARPISAWISIAAFAAAGTVTSVFGEPFAEDFEGTSLAGFPPDPWLDAANAIENATVPAPTGQVVETIGLDGDPTRAFQISRSNGTSAGLLREIAESDWHHLTADIRVDHHPSSYPFNTWTSAVGFINRTGRPDFNYEPTAIVLVFERKWHFFSFNGAGSSNFTLLKLSDELVNAGDWYGVSLEVDTVGGRFGVQVVRNDGSEFASQVVDVPAWTETAGMYDHVAVFDGEYSEVETSGQFTVDNITYVPAPGPSLSSIGVLALFVCSRRRATG